MLLIKEYIRLILEEEEQQMTWGKLKKQLKYFTGLKKGKNVAKAAVGFVPFLGGARDLADVVRSLISIPDGKRPKGFLSKFDLDDKIQQIVDNDIEEDFVKYLMNYIEEKNDDEVIQDFNINKVLDNFLALNYDGRGIRGY
jgi:hypothetical protein